ncbi:hypothetical protein CIPAW_08G052400 [Carya illinoinensis]|uniref:Uncharacterized protein n=1 Tax=Carya illinoinensis TaxID=32201 RepID=A0A8T1PQC7_CARIL|nr:hypothetical protein CIPAW_08G052400 [Carya illinoinensis]
MWVCRPCIQSCISISFLYEQMNVIYLLLRIWREFEAIQGNYCTKFTLFEPLILVSLGEICPKSPKHPFTKVHSFPSKKLTKPKRKASRSITFSGKDTKILTN